jgi:thiol:disulfide interchange protein DsbD
MRILNVLLVLWSCSLPVFAEERASAATGLKEFAQELLGQKPGGGLSLGAASREFLEPDRAFVLTVEEKDPATLVARWEIAEGYYLYRDKFSFKLDQPGFTLGNISLPRGKIKADPNFGDVEINTGAIEVELPLKRRAPEAATLQLTVAYQGCAEDGICYPPMEKTLPVQLSAMSGDAPSANVKVDSSGQEPLSTQDDLARRLASDAKGLTLLSFLGFGLMLSLTPCVFPMVPILSGILVRQGEGLTAMRGFGLSLVFVVASALTYAGMGVLAGLFGQNLQTMFQNPWIISVFAGFFVLLALSMFGFFKLQLPASWQSRISSASNRTQRGTFHGAALMGSLSTLIVGPCVAPPLAGALMYIGQTGNATLGGLALFALGLGMGGPLMLIGASAGKLLPKAGMWMETVQRVFGVILLGVALWFLERILPGPLTVLLWGLLMTVTAIYMGALDSLDPLVSGWKRLSKGIGIAALVYGAALIVGAAGGATDVFRPLASMGLTSKTGAQELVFAPVKGMAGLDQAIAMARAQGKPAMLDLYADWCVECKELEKYTFSDSAVQQALSKVVLLKADVTANDEVDKDLLERLGLYGPPALLFFSSDGKELSRLRVVGFISAAELQKHLDRLSS